MLEGQEEWLHLDQIVSHASTAPCGQVPLTLPMGLWFLQWEKENPWWTSSFLGISKSPTQVSPHSDYWGNIWSSTTEEQIRECKGHQGSW